MSSTVDRMYVRDTALPFGTAKKGKNSGCAAPHQSLTYSSCPRSSSWTRKTGAPGGAPGGSSTECTSRILGCLLVQQTVASYCTVSRAHSHFRVLWLCRLKRSPRATSTTLYQTMPNSRTCPFCILVFTYRPTHTRLRFIMCSQLDNNGWSHPSVK